jgi:3-isopropylmalate/(R)-2-methylmalate dehydratase small subunit
MEKFTTLTAVAAPLLVPNVNTDVIIRIERLVELPRGALGPYCFEAWRYRADGTEDPDFLLNKTVFREAKILLVGANFGCGSSREAAVWSLWDLGYRCVIAPSFGEIFQANCFQNGMLPIVLPADTVDALASAIDRDTPVPITVDLVSKSIMVPNIPPVAFGIDDEQRAALLEGLDEIMMTFRREQDITAFQQTARVARPWLFDLPLLSKDKFIHE